MTKALWALLYYNNNIKWFDPLPSEVSRCPSSVGFLSLSSCMIKDLRNPLFTVAFLHLRYAVLQHRAQPLLPARRTLTGERAECQPVRWKWFPIILQRVFSGSM